MRKWDGFEEFEAVAAAGSFAGAAHRLGLSTSHVSRAVARLEARLSARLFFRTTRKVTLTENGRVLLEQCRRIMEELDEAIAAASGSAPQGELRLTCSTAIGERFVAPIVRRFATDHPRMRVTIELTNRVVDLISEGFDLAIRTGHLADSRLVATRIASRQLRLCAAPAYLDRVGRPSNLAELSGHDCLVGAAPNWRFLVNDEEQVFRPRGRWRCNSGVALVDAALAGMGLCQLPEFYLMPHIKSGRLELVLDALQVREEPIWAVYPQRRHLLPSVKELIERLRLELNEALRGASSGG